MRTLTNFNKTPLHSINFKTIFSVVALICFTQIGFGQATIYSENFTGQNGKGAIGSASGATTDLSGVDWTIDISSATLSADTDWFKVTNEIFEARDIDGNAIWQSKSINISGFSNVSLSLSAVEVGTMESSDIFKTEYRIDGGTWTPADTNGSLNDDFTSATVSQTGLSGSTLEIRVTMNNGAASEYHRLDDILVEGTASSSPTIGFDAASSSQTETDETFNVSIPVTVSNYGTDQIDVSIAVSGSAEVADYTLNTASLSFTSDGSQNISLDINPDIDDYDDETITLTLTETSSVSGLFISQSTHTLTIADDDLPSGSIPYSEDFSDCGTQNWTVFTVGAQQEWTCDGDGYFEANAFGSSGAADDYLVSPEFNMDGQSGETLSFTSWTQYADTTYPRIELLYTTNFTGDVSTTTWNSSLSPTFSPENSQAETESGDVDISGLTGTSIVFAFRYTSSGTGVGSTSRWRVDNINIAISVTWQGDDPITPNDWSTAANWSTGAVPTSSDAVVIDGTFTNEPTITSTDAVALSVTVASGNTLTIDETSSLTVSGDFTNTGTVTLNSTEDDFSSLIVEGTAMGDITYNRYVNSYDTNPDGGGWDFVCSPVTMSIADFITANGAAGANVIEILGDDYAFASYDNAAGQWNLYATDTSTGSFTTGQGYAMATNAGDGATVAFTGAMKTADQSIDIINNNGVNGVGRRWNLVSNPFPSYINGNDLAGATNFIGANTAVIDGGFGALYGWNGSDYDIYNLLDDAFSIAPGQAFWVAALNTTDTALNFTAAMRTTSGSGDFVAGPQILTYHVALELYNGETQKATTNFYFRDGLSLDLDPWYDAGAYNQSTKLSSRLAQGSQEIAFARNAMGMDAMQNTRVPLEIRQNAGQAFTISIADMNLPEDIYVYLEDTVNGTLTSLKEGNFELEAQSDLSGLDRFFIVFKSNSVLSNGDAFGIEALNVYKANSDSFVTIAGISPELGKLNVSLYNILGQTVREKALNPTTATQTISTQGLASGLYIIQLKSGNQVFTKKIVVQ